jgi:hypothetical protein
MMTIPEERTEGAEWLKVYFESCRFDEAYHLGLGDIRLTIADQEYIINVINSIEEDD